MKAFCLLLCVSMLAGMVGCGEPKQSVGESDSVQVSATRESGSEPFETEESKTEEKIRISDFYQYANGDWLNTLNLDGENNYAERNNYLIQKQNATILNWIDSDASTLSDDKGMYNVIRFLQQVMKEDENEALVTKKLMEDMEIIDRVSGLDELYELYKQDFYLGVNNIWNVSLERLGSSYYHTLVYPMPLFSDTRQSEYGNIEDEFNKLLIEAGFEKAEASKIAKNAAMMELLLLQYYENSDGTLNQYNRFVEEERGLQVPVVAVLAEQEMVNLKKQYLAPPDLADLFNMIYQEQNLEILKDYLKFGTAIRIKAGCCMSYMDPLSSAMKQLYGYTDEMDGFEYDILMHAQTFRMSGTLSRYYTEVTLGAERMAALEDMTKDIIGGVRAMIKGSSWLSVHGKELAQRKINHMGIYLGTDGTENVFDDWDFQDNVYDNVKKIYGCLKDAERKKTDENTRIIEITSNPLEYNAYYNAGENAFMFGSAALSILAEYPDASYETMLGLIGETMAHEIGHAYDYNGSLYDENGVENMWMTEEEYNEYLKIVENVKNFYDGKTSNLGNKIDGDLVKMEAFADMMAVECCLKILEQRESSDYDAFFTAYAKCFATAYTKEYEEESIITDTHAPIRERINYTLGQFDRFYQVYDVDAGSPYYIKSEDRAWQLWETK